MATQVQVCKIGKQVSSCHWVLDSLILEGRSKIEGVNRTPIYIVKDKHNH